MRPRVAVGGSEHGLVHATCTVVGYTRSERAMKRMTGLMVVALLAAACGGDEETSPPATDASTIDDAATDDSEAA
ncbi:MAG: hypothetical protein ACO225_13695, partial [Ilumatobacteraceae bacterium]